MAADDAKVGVNPKINNLITPFSQASNDLLWVIDSTISVLPDSLARAVETFTGVPIISANGESSWTAASDLESTPLIGDNIREPPPERAMLAWCTTCRTRWSTRRHGAA